MAVKKNSSKNKPAFSFFSNSFDEIFSGKFSDVRHFSPFARFLPLYSSAVIRKVPWQVGVSDSHLFGLYQLNIECRLLFYQLLIPDKGERASVILPLWVWELGFPKKNGNLEPTKRSRQISKYCLSPSAFVVLRKCSQSKRHLCITTSSPAPHTPFSLASL